jgi:hypothetical protein
MRLCLLALSILSCTLLVAQQRFDIVIDEIMADPSPQIGLPGNEWIEIKNCSPYPINLQNWRIGDANSLSGPLPNYTLQADSFLVICGTSALPAMSAFGAAVAISSFPSLDNEGDVIFLQTSGGMTMHAIRFTSDWYRNSLKKEGGWSLEMIDPKNPCAASINWQASIHPAGGTPGSANSINGSINDESPPKITGAYTLDDKTIILEFDEPLDSASAAQLPLYQMNGEAIFTEVVVLRPLFASVQLKTLSPLLPARIYTLTVANLKDCRQNEIAANNSTRIGLPSDPAPGEWIINEILFNPHAGAYDYVECLNTSNRIFDASKLYIANRNSSGAVSSIKALSSVPKYVFPGDYIVLTENAGSLGSHYSMQVPGNVFTVPGLPSFPDDSGTVILLNLQGIITDETRYNANWHFKLIANPEGVSLERIDPDGRSSDPANWHSAGSTAGYGTPTSKNSQFKLLPAVPASFSVTPGTFSPDNDGLDDIASIQYKLSEPGYMATISIFDAGGRSIRRLVRNQLLAMEGYWNWDGLDEKGQQLPIGVYIILAEVFNLHGNHQQFRMALVLARRLR